VDPLFIAGSLRKLIARAAGPTSQIYGWGSQPSKNEQSARYVGRTVNSAAEST
jgi:hypothetical protein